MAKDNQFSPVKRRTESQSLDTHVNGKSDEVVVVKKRSNKTKNQGFSAAESVEQRTSVKGNSDQKGTSTIQSVAKALSGLDRVRKAAKKDRALKFSNIMHHITFELLKKSYFSIRRNGAVGVDGQSWVGYGKKNLEEKLQVLHERLQSGRYRVKPSKRVWIPKSEGGQRPLGIPSLEDKIVQQALSWVLEAIYESNFMGFSYGFRAERSCHNALDAVYMAITTRKVSWVLDADIEKFFDQVNHDKLMEYIGKRVTDPRIHHLVRRFLTAGISEEGRWKKTEVGTPQGGILSPLLANIFLHNAFDLWISNWRKTSARGEVYVIRYADDSVVCFQYQNDAIKCLEQLRRQLAENGLKLHQNKTRLIEFGRFAKTNRAERGVGKPETFEFLGFTHFCSQRRKDGKFTVHRKTSRKRLSKKMKEIRTKLFQNRHRKIKEIAPWLRSVIVGHLNYFSIPGNLFACNQFRTEIVHAWINALRKRSQKARKYNWSRFKGLIERWIPRVRILHPYPNQRLIV